jgi:hypothetical protein
LVKDLVPLAFLFYLSGFLLVWMKIETNELHSPTLRGSEGLMECFLCSVWALLGYASIRQGVISELVDGGSYEECCGLENGPPLYFVVYLEGAKQ